MVPVAGVLLRNVLALGTGQLLSWIGAAILAVALPKYLGEENLGRLAFAMSLTALTGVLVDVGATTFVTKEVARAPERFRNVAVTAALLRLPLGVCAALVSIVVANALRSDATTRLIVYVLAMEVVLGSIGGVAAATLQGLQQMRLVAAATAVTRFGYAALATVLLVRGAGPVEVAVVAFGSTVIRGLLLSGTLVRAVSSGGRVSRAEAGKIMRGGLPFFASQAALLVYGQIDMLMLALFTSDAVVGWYAAAYRIVGVAVFVPGIVAAAVFPALAAAAKDRRMFTSIVQRAIQAIILLGIPIVVAVTVLAMPFMVWLRYPSSFVNSLGPIALLAPCYVLSGVDMIIGSALVALDRQRPWAIVGVTAAILNPALNLLAIPYAQSAWGNGALGAAAVTTLTEVYLMVIGLRMLPRGTLGRESISTLVRTIVASAAAGVVMVGTREFPLWIPAVAGAAVYAVAALAFGAVSRADLLAMRSNVLMRPQPGHPSSA